ncbi:TPA: hypothetical protein DEB00_03195 [Candidatus Uhrbacteria bacterium]|nr:hypothetical protein [Candidatus Uhrbacteria bacterium]
MNTSTPKFLVEGLRLVSVCPACKKDGKTNVHILKSDRQTGLVHVTCQTCSHTMMAFLEQQRGGVSCVGLITDLSLQDARYFLDRQCLTADDVLLAHETLTTGDFLNTLLKPPCS